ncbi:hypothetical protein [Ectothiorhodospira sp. BSL-9]|uniref:hypothetical protein n=1 Tax=Ectothiorhodospira sp. BSL-9 TaxID=1442136 RepID=UPI0012E90481|nr:hypothetical protein [Ectothiorhodospira sp. BSL-9]
MFLFLHSILAVKRQIGPELYAAVAGYRQHAPSEAWAAARTWAWWLAGLGRLSVWIQTWRPDTGDVVAIPHTLQVLRNDVGRSTHYDNEGA